MFALKAKLKAISGPWRMLLILSSLVTITAGCATVDYENVGVGRFRGSVFVMWVGEGGQSGDGRFLFVPDPRDPLRFYRPPSARNAPMIQPRMMYTDGGSIPKAAQLFNGLSPWGYAPAYMIHDWLFKARHCLVDGADDEAFAPLHSVSFDDSAIILGEAIKTLIAERRVQENDLAPNAITGAVGSPVARRLWDATGACAKERVSDEHAAAANAAIPGSARFGRRFGGQAPSRYSAKVITRVSF